MEKITADIYTGIEHQNAFQPIDLFKKMKQLLINYIVKPDKVDENATLIKQVFEQLKGEQLQGVKYAVYKMGGNIFVHIAQFESETAHQQFTAMESFKAFRQNMAERQIEKPVINDIEEVGSFSNPGD